MPERRSGRRSIPGPRILLLLCLAAAAGTRTVPAEPPTVGREPPPFQAFASATTELGFFSGYVGASAGVRLRPGRMVLGLNQAFLYGFRYREVAGRTEARIHVHESVFLLLGASWLLAESPLRTERDFRASLLPVIGFGASIPAGPGRPRVVPEIRMNQSFYLSDRIRPVYTELPFLVGMTIGLSLEYPF